MRAGAHALSILSSPLNDQLLSGLADGPMQLPELRRAAGSPPQSTLRSHVRSLIEFGVIERRRHREFPVTVDYEIATPGRELLEVREVLGAWLAEAADGPVALGTPAAKSAIKALVDGWSSTIIRAVVARPLSLTELNRLISGHNYPSLERRFGAMRLAGLLRQCPGEARKTPYAVNPWLRHAVAPLAAAARWERRHMAVAAPPLSRIDIEALFLLAVPLVRLSPTDSGVCRLVAEIRGAGQGQDLAGAMVELRDGAVRSCVSRLRGDADAWATGSSSAWLRALIGEDSDGLELGGDVALVSSLVDRLHGSLFPVPQGA